MEEIVFGDDTLGWKENQAYVVEGVYGVYHKGDWFWGEDDDEDWYFDKVRLATETEILAECLDDAEPHFVQ